jgi:nucleoside-diphosphate-sugar epimerase
MLGAELAGSKRPLVVASGVAGLRTGKLLTEDYLPNKLVSVISPRKSETTALTLVSKGVNASVVRLSPSVHGDGDQGFAKWLIDIARKKGVSAYIGNGHNRWSAVHRLDVACLFRLAVENGSSGAIYHAAAEEGVAVEDIAKVIGRQLDVPVISKSRMASFSHFGRFFGFVVGLDCPTSNKETQERLGWHPIQPSLLEDLEQGNYYFKT